MLSHPTHYVPSSPVHSRTVESGCDSTRGCGSGNWSSTHRGPWREQRHLLRNWGSPLSPALLAPPCANIGTNKATGGGSASPEALLSSQAPGSSLSPPQLQSCPGTPPANCCAGGQDGARSCKHPTRSQCCWLGLSRDHPEPPLPHQCCSQGLKSCLGIKRKQGESYQLTSEH